MTYMENDEKNENMNTCEEIIAENNDEGNVCEAETVCNVDEPVEKKKHTGLKIFIGIVIGFVLGIACCVVLELAILNNKVGISDANEVVENITDSKSNSSSKLTYIIGLIKSYYYEDVDDSKLIEGIYSGLVDSLGDPYSAYYTKEEYDDLMISYTGEYAGIGATLSKNLETGLVTVVKVYAGTPAEKSGIQKDDILISADGFMGVDNSLDEFVQHIRGEAGTDVTLLVNRGGKELEIVCTRDVVTTPTVEYQMLKNKIGYIQISQFSGTTSEDFIKAMEDLQAQGMRSVIFDLRSNGGGLVDAVTSMLDYLLPEGTVVYTLDKNGEREDYKSTNNHSVKLPMVVLVDGNTASASEIFTGAIRDFNYGTIIGTKTYGKGIVQSTIPLGDGSALKITTETYYTPSGECIHGVGIAPDIELKYEFLGSEDDVYSIEFDNQIQKAIDVLKLEM